MNNLFACFRPGSWPLYLAVLLLAAFAQAAPALTLVSASNVGDSDTQFDLLFSEPVNQAEAQNLANYTASGFALNSATLQPDNRTVRFTTTSLASFWICRRLTVSNVHDRAGPPNVIAPNSEIGVVYGTSSIRYRLFANIAGGAVNDLLNHPFFPGLETDDLNVHSDYFEWQSDPSYLFPGRFRDNFGAQLIGLLSPPVDGNYTFYIASDDASALWLSTDENPVNKVRIANNPIWSEVRQWTGQASGGGRDCTQPGSLSCNISAPISLRGGCRYYVEMVLKEAGGSLEHGEVTWQLPGAPVPANGSLPIPGRYLSPFGGDVPPSMPLVAEGAVWRYLANGSDQGTAWRSNGFNATSWPSGAARLGFGGDGEATVIGNATNGIVTYYFRKTFTVANAASIGNLFGQVQVDDGVILYLNGAEIYRRNMTNSAATLNYRSLASAAVEGAAETTFWTFLTNASALVNGVNVLAAEVHQSSTNDSDLGWNLDLVGNYNGALPPVITITSPTNIVPYHAAGIPLLANARDPEGTVTNVDFFVDGLRAARSATAPFSGAWTNVTPGYHEIFARATDDTGLSTTSSVASFAVGPPIVTVPPPPLTLVATGAVWKYLADGSDQFKKWRKPDHNDTAWPSGPARLGFGAGGEATVIGNATNGIITFYFRKTFTVADAASISNLSIRAQVDDGVILYLNDMEIFRRNMTNTEATLNYRSLASAFGFPSGFVTFFTNTSALAEGVNVLAAEVHQASTNSSDLAWNLELQGVYSTLPPVITIASPTNAAPYSNAIPLLVNASDPDGTVTNVDFYVDYVYAGSATNAPFSGAWTNATLGRHEVFAWARDNAGFTAFSPVANFTVTVPPLVSTLVNSNSMWKYLDDGSDQGTAWRANGFNDAGWANGMAELGYGDGDEVTTVRSNRLDGSRIVTTYFRKTFNVENPARYYGLVVRLKRDDGGVVYLNGAEIFRSSMTNAPGVPVIYTDFAAATADEAGFSSMNASGSLLRAGDNVLAVEIHQANLTSTDISFDLQLHGESGPELSITRSGSVVTLSWIPAVPGLQLQFAPTITGPWFVSPYQENPQSFTVPGNPPVFLAFWRLLVP